MHVELLLLLMQQQLQLRVHLILRIAHAAAGALQAAGDKFVDQTIKNGAIADQAINKIVLCSL